MLTRILNIVLKTKTVKPYTNEKATSKTESLFLYIELFDRLTQNCFFSSSDLSKGEVKKIPEVETSGI